MSRNQTLAGMNLERKRRKPSVNRKRRTPLTLPAPHTAHSRSLDGQTAEPVEMLDGFAWETLRSFLDGVSPIDLTQLAFYSRDQAREFLLHYGYDLDRPAESQDAWNVYREALDYLGRVLCPAPIAGDVGLRVPTELSRVEEVADLLIMASSSEPMGAWACALLRVMHTISHANHAVRSPFYPEIQKQILDLYRAHLYENGTSFRGALDGSHVGGLFLGHGDAAIPLEGVYFREEKSRESLILKLLHKMCSTVSASSWSLPPGSRP
jgi:uncharacterized protein (TIGR04562 family)